MQVSSSFVEVVARKINGEYFLNREEVIDYLLYAFQVRWCMTKWEGGKIRITYQLTDSSRGTKKFPAYICPKTKIVRLRKYELDSFFDT